MSKNTNFLETQGNVRKQHQILLRKLYLYDFARRDQYNLSIKKNLSFYITVASRRRFLPLGAEILKFLALRSLCNFVLETGKTAGKPNVEWLDREKKKVMSISEKSTGRPNYLSFLNGPGIKVKSTKCKSAILVCLTSFSSD